MTRETAAGSGPRRASRHSPETFNVLVVCLANHCRSPLMEFLLRRQVELRNLNWVVSSAGTAAVPGIPAHPYSTEILAERGIDTRGWVSRPLDTQAISDAQLILTATEDQRDAVVEMDVNAAHHTFPLLQFAFMARMLRPPRLLVAAELGPWLLAESYYKRKRIDQLALHERDVEDPMGRTINRFRQCAQLIDNAYADILAPGPAARRA